MSRVLFLTQVLPYPLDAGPKIRAYYVLRYLSQKHRITLLTFIRPDDSPASIEHLTQFCDTIETVMITRSRVQDLAAMGRSLFMNEPLLISRDRVPAMDRALEIAVTHNRYDVIHADQLWMAPYALRASALAQRNGYQPCVILDQHNAVHLIPKRMAAEERNPIKKAGWKRENRLMANYEVDTCEQFDLTTWVTREDLAAIQDISYNSTQSSFNHATVIPICIEPQNAGNLAPLDDRPRILFLGGMHWPPNADAVGWFVNEIYPRVKAIIPEAEFLAIGKNPPAEILRIPGVVAPGYVEEVESYFQSSRVFVVPIRAGGGMRVKILNAWDQGLPIVSTTIGAEGIECESGKNVLIADDPEGFASAILKILQDKDCAHSLRVAGRAAVQEHYDWKQIYTAWDQVYQAATAPASEGPSCS
jgi:glycosyltransferase involved in cell wall biosynthesis